jgi:tellurite resistance protein TehA-like permease
MGHVPPFAEGTWTLNLAKRCDHIRLCAALFKKRLEPSSVQSTLLTYSWVLDLFSIVCCGRLVSQIPHDERQVDTHHVLIHAEVGDTQP